MIKGVFRKNISREDIFDKVDDYNIIRFYLGSDFDFKKAVPSPFRAENKPDKTPNLKFFKNKEGKIIWKDFALDEPGGDAITFVMRLGNNELTYQETIEKIKKDFGIDGNGNTSKDIKLRKAPEASQHIKKTIQIIAKKFSNKDLEYWGQFYITKGELEKKNVLSIQKLWLNKQLITNPKKELRFAYPLEEYIKIYIPENKDFKWISTIPINLVSGIREIISKIDSGTQDKKLVITKSVKDEILLKKFFRDVCSTQNECHVSLSEENIQKILTGYKPEDVYIAFDNDKTGVKSSKYYTEKYGFNYINVPKIYIREKITDWGDLVKEKDLETMERYLQIKKLI